MRDTKKTVAGIMAFAMMLTLASCSGNKGSSGENGDVSSGNSAASNDSSVTAEQVMEKSYKAIEIGGVLPLTYLNTIKAVGNSGKVFISGGDDEGNMAMYMTDHSFEDFTEIPFELEKPDNGYSNYNTVVGSDGTIYLFITTTTYGDVKMPDWDDPDFDKENFDWEEFYAAAESSYKVCTIDENGSVLSDAEVTGLEEYIGEEDDEDKGYIGNIFICGNNLMLTIGRNMGGESLVTVGTDGVIGDEVDFDGDLYNLYESITDDDGNVWFSSWEDDGISIKKLDASTMKVSDEQIMVDREEVNYINRFVPGSDDYKFYVSGQDSLFGLKEDGTLDEIINWLDSDLNGDYITNIFPEDNGEFIIYESNWSTGDQKFYRLTKRDASEISNVEIITMVTQYEDTDAIAKINEFNKSHDGYRIKMESYQKYYKWDDESGSLLNSPEMQLKMDIAAGKSFDIICMGGDSSLFTMLGKKGALIDLYDYMGTNGTVAKDDIVPNLLEAGEIGGKLVSLSPTFNVNTYMAKKKFIDKEGWSIDDMIETYNSLPDGMRLTTYSMNKIDVFNNFVAYGGFIDYENATCSFDSPEFIKLLKFCNDLEDYQEPDWESMTSDEQQNYWMEMETACRNDKALLENVYISNPRDFIRYKYGLFNEETCMVGNPSSDGKGAILSPSTSYAIMANSKNADVAWEFISSLFSEKEQSGDRMYTLPALKSAFEKKLDDTMEKPYYTDEDGKKHEYDNVWYIGNEQIKLPVFTQEERDDLERYILTAKPVISEYYGSDIGNIVKEEAEAYFKGGRSAEEAADLIQNRVSILVSEQF